MHSINKKLQFNKNNLFTRYLLSASHASYNTTYFNTCKVLYRNLSYFFTCKIQMKINTFYKKNTYNVHILKQIIYIIKSSL